MSEEKIRINKYLARLGVCSRRGADDLIINGHVTVNGRLAIPGDAVSDTDSIAVDGKIVNASSRQESILIAYNKPIGIVCSTVNQGKEHNNIVDAINYPSRIFPIGRLDKDSEGLILLTNDGDLSDRLMRAANHYEKEYEVVTDHLIDDNFLNRIRNGIAIELKDGSTYTTRKCQATKLSDNSFSIILTEGKNRQIRRMCEALGHNVTNLKRIRIQNILLNDIPTGKYVELSPDNLKL